MRLIFSSLVVKRDIAEPFFPLYPFSPKGEKIKTTTAMKSEQKVRKKQKKKKKQQIVHLIELYWASTCIFRHFLDWSLVFFFSVATASICIILGTETKKWLPNCWLNLVWYESRQQQQQKQKENKKKNNPTNEWILFNKSIKAATH